MIAMELARVDPSIATFFGVHGGLAMGSIYLCGSRGAEGALAARDGPDGEDRRLRAHRARRGLRRGRNPDDDRAARRRPIWVLNGQKKWIGNATFADHIIVWARSMLPTTR